MDSSYKAALDVAVGVLADRLQQLLAEQSMTHTDVWRALNMSESGYYRMLKKGSIDLRKVAAISTILKIDPMRFLSPKADLSSKGARPYVEDRVEQLERKVRQLETQLKKR